MIRGSHVNMRTLDEYMTPTGSFYSATIDNNMGDFNYGALKINSPYAQLTADGYFLMKWMENCQKVLSSWMLLWT